MKILHLNRLDIDGGAARGTYWLHQALLEAEVESIMLVQKKSSQDFSVLGPQTMVQKVFNRLKPELERVPLILYPNRQSSLFFSFMATQPTPNQN